MLSTMPPARKSRALFLVGLLLTMHGFFVVPFLVAHAPLEKTMGIVQKIFYFHVPCAWLLMLSTFVCAGAVWRTFFADRSPGIVWPCAVPSWVCCLACA